jgi:hypothetical protein
MSVFDLFIQDYDIKNEEILQDFWLFLKTFQNFK